MQAAKIRDALRHPHPAATFLYRLFTQAALAEKIQLATEDDWDMLLNVGEYCLTLVNKIRRC